MKKIITIRTFLSDYSFGYETTQIFRHKVLTELGYEHILINGTPFESEHWKLKLRSLGFDPDTVIILPREYSDIEFESVGYTAKDFEKDYLDKYEWTLKQPDEYTWNYKIQGIGYFTLEAREDKTIRNIFFRDKSLRFIYTIIVKEKPYYKYYENASFEYFNRDGSIALSGKKFNNESCEYEINGKKFTQEQLFIDYLSRIKEDFLVINDQIGQQYSELKLYCKQRKIPYRDVLHFNHEQGRKNRDDYTLKLDEEIFVASPYIIPFLKTEGTTGVFIPPMGVEVSKTVPKGLSSNKFLIVSNYDKGKRIEMAVKAFSKLPHLQLDIYGGFIHDIGDFRRDNEIPDNVNIKGFVESENIPRDEYLGYISCSKSEMFANAMVECLCCGLIPILSKVDYGHNQVLEELSIKDTNGFESVEELIEAVKYVVSLNEDERQKVSKKILEYSYKFNLENSKNIYAKAIERIINEY